MTQIAFSDRQTDRQTVRQT